MDARKFRTGRCRPILLVCLWALSGCHLPGPLRFSDESLDDPKPPDAAAAGKSAGAKEALPELPKVLADDHWVQASALSIRTPSPAGYFWQHHALEAWAAAGGDHQAVLRHALAGGHPVVAGNAAILLARTGDTTVVEPLASVVGNVELNLPLRCAAVEALGRLDDPAARETLVKLATDFGRYGGPAQAAYVPRLHVELVAELARSGGDASNAVLSQALASPASAVRREALLAWRHSSRSNLPELALELRDDEDPAVRAALLAALAVQKPAAAREILTRALNDLNIDVRLAAVDGLAELGGAESEAALRKLQLHPAEMVRAAAVGGLARLGASDAVEQAAKDKSWLVRQAVAGSLAQPVKLQPAAPEGAAADRPVTDQSIALAQTLLTDKSLEVQRRALESVATWPLPQSGPILLATMADGGHQMRKQAARSLATRWTAAERFPYDSDADVRAGRVAELRTQWEDQFGPLARPSEQTPAALPVATAPQPDSVDSLRAALEVLRAGQSGPDARQRAIEQLVAAGPAVVPALEKITAASGEPLPSVVYEEVLPLASPLFAAIDALRSRQLPQRRTAAAQMVVAAGGQKIPRLALERLAELAPAESDPIVWQGLLTVTADDSRELAVTLAYLAIGNGSPDVRRRACNYLAAHGDPRHVPVLLPALADLNTPVVIAAVQALGASGKLDDPRPLVQLLLTPNKLLRLEVATSLARLGAPEGPAALERLSLDADGEVCRRSAVAMGQLGDQHFVPLLVELLGAPVDVQNAALASLTQLTGEDFSKSAEGLPVARDEQVRRWQRWQRDRQERALQATDPAESQPVETQAGETQPIEAPAPNAQQIER